MKHSIEIRELRAGEESALHEAWTRAFANARAPRTLEEWRWAYRDAPGGARSVVALRDGRIVAHAGGRRARTWIDGREHGFMQMVDAFAAPEERRGLARRATFVETARALLDRCAARGELAYGWPTRAHARLGARLLGYERVRTELVLAKELDAPAPAPPPAERVASFGADATSLWERCASDWRASTIRDAAWLAWRYLARPGARYAPLARRAADGTLAALAVLAPPGFFGEDVALLVDWLVPAGDADLGRELLAQAEHEAARGGARALAALVPPWSPWFARWQDAGWRAHESPLVLHCAGARGLVDASFLASAWWAGLGDSDLA